MGPEFYFMSGSSYYEEVGVHIFVLICQYMCVFAYSHIWGRRYMHCVHMCVSVVEGQSGDICAPMYKEMYKPRSHVCMLVDLTAVCISICIGMHA